MKWSTWANYFLFTWCRFLIKLCLITLQTNTNKVQQVNRTKANPIKPGFTLKCCYQLSVWMFTASKTIIRRIRILFLIIIMTIKGLWSEHISCGTWTSFVQDDPSKKMSLNDLFCLKSHKYQIKAIDARLVCKTKC